MPRSSWADKTRSCPSKFRYKQYTSRQLLLLCSTPPLMILGWSLNWPKVYADNLSFHVFSKGITKVIPLLDTWETWPARQKRVARWEPLKKQIMLMQFASFWGCWSDCEKAVSFGPATSICVHTSQCGQMQVWVFQNIETFNKCIINLLNYLFCIFFQKWPP